MLPLPETKSSLPQPPPFRKIIGPSFIILGLGLGSGEVILWPYLASNYGLGLAWAAILGITMQFFLNMEVERYAVINGESIFVGFARIFKYLPVWFILSTFLGFGWPGIGLSGVSLISSAFGLPSVKLATIIAFLLIGLILSLGRVLYTTVETLQKILISLGLPFLLILAFFLVKPAAIFTLAQGVIGLGDGFFLLPAGIPLLTFLGALAYSGAGGNLNLAQSFYIKDKGYGMGKFSQPIKSLLTDPHSSPPLRLTGYTFPLTPKNISRFRRWWRLINLEHALIFWFLGLFTMLLLSLLAYSTAFGHPNNPSGLNFLITESRYIGQLTFPLAGIVFLLVTGTMLIATQLTVLDSTSRIITENFLLLNPGRRSLSRTYYLTLWLQILFGIAVILLGFDQPRTLVTLGGAVNAFTMFSYLGLILYLNNRLKKPLRPSLLRNAAILFTFIFFGFFCTLTLLRP